jgi:hypothetical protein
MQRSFAYGRRNQSRPKEAKPIFSLVAETAEALISLLSATRMEPRNCRQIIHYSHLPQ